VVRRLRKQGSYSVRTGLFGNIWTPEPPGNQQRLPMGFMQMLGRGRAAYSLSSDGTTVHLLWRPKTGPPREWAGPVPAVSSPIFQRRNRRGIATAASAFFGSAAVGAIIGASTGRLVAGAVTGAIVGYFLGTSIWSSGMVRSFRAVLAAQDASRPQH